jgi:uncharacterized Zn finger protein
MSRPPQLDEHDIRLYVGSQHFQHGAEYVRNGSILDMRRRGMMVKARCQEVSGDLFLPQVMFGEEGIVDASCTCPKNRDSAEHCVHIAALLLCWQGQPEASARRRGWTSIDRSHSHSLCAGIYGSISSRAGSV